MTPDLSLVICTRNRAMQLRRCLEVLRQQDYSPYRWELVLVNNGSSDDTDFVIRADAMGLPVSVVIVDEPRIGQSRARNAGVRAAKAPLIAFTDDDCYVAKDYVARMVHAFERQDVDYVGGRIELHDPTDAPETIQTRPYRKEFDPGLVLMPGELHGANMAFRRQVWETIGGFDPDLGPGTPFVCDDVDFLTRASLAGFEGLYDPMPLVWHHHGRKPGRDVDLLHKVYASGRGAYYAKGCLDAAHRGEFARQWHWHLRTQFSRHRYAELIRELWAGASYLLGHHATADTTTPVRVSHAHSTR